MFRQRDNSRNVSWSLDKDASSLRRKIEIRLRALVATGAFGASWVPAVVGAHLKGLPVSPVIDLPVMVASPALCLVVVVLVHIENMRLIELTGRQIEIDLILGAGATSELTDPAVARSADATRESAAGDTCARTSSRTQASTSSRRMTPGKTGVPLQRRSERLGRKRVHTRSCTRGPAHGGRGWSVSARSRESKDRAR